MEGKYQAYPEYKNTGILGLDSIPSHWESKRIKFLFNIGRGRVIAEQELEENGRYPVYSSQTKNNGCLGYIDSYDFDCEQITWTTDGANAGTVFLRKGKHNCTNVCGTLQSKFSDDSMRFTLYSLEYVTQFHKRPDTNGAKIMNNEMAEISIAQPPLLDRLKIANFLDHETAKIDTLIENQQQLIKLLKEKRQAVISHAVTKGINPDVPMRDSGVEWLGEVPEHWVSTEIRYIASQMGGGTPSKERPEFWSGDIPWVSPKDMKVDYISDSQDKITTQAVQQSSAKLIPAGSVLIVVRGMILAHSVPVAITEREVTINQDMKALMPEKQMHGEFLLFFIQGLRDFILDLVEESAHGTKCLRSEEFERMKIAVPKLQEQVEIVAELKEQLIIIDKLIGNSNHATELLKERRTALISAAVTGKIDVRNWSAPNA